MKFSHNCPLNIRSTSLSRKKSNVGAAPPRPVAARVAVVIPPTPDLPESRIEPVLARYALPIVLCLIAIASARIISTYNVFSITADEPAHIACGLEWLTKHVYLYETQHPPLTRVMIALPPYLAGARTQGMPQFGGEGWAIVNYQHHPDRTLFLMRLGNLPFFVLGCFVVFLWARRYFGAAVGVVATGFFTMIPTVSRMPDRHHRYGLAACLGAAFLAMLVWAEQPTPVHGAVFGLCTALALLSKFTALGFLPVGAAVAFLFYLAAERPGVAKLIATCQGARRQLRNRRGSLLVRYLGNVLFLRRQGALLERHASRVGIFRRCPRRPAAQHAGPSRVPAGRTAHLRLVDYFPVGLAVKTPIALLLLLFIGLWTCWKNRARLPWLLPAALAIGVLVPAMSGNVNIGVRHVLPVYIAISIIAALGFVYLLRRARFAKWAAGLLVLWLAATGALHHPDYIPYFNELVPFPQDQVLCDSDYDWGQDLKRLAARLHQLGATQVNYHYLVAGDNKLLEDYLGLPPITAIHPLKPAEGWTAVCPTLDHTTQYGLEYRYPNLKPWYSTLTPKERVGTIDLYYLPPGSLTGKK